MFKKHLRVEYLTFLRCLNADSDLVFLIGARQNDYRLILGDPIGWLGWGDGGNEKESPLHFLLRNVIDGGATCPKMPQVSSDPLTTLKGFIICLRKQTLFRNKIPYCVFSATNPTSNHHFFITKTRGFEINLFYWNMRVSVNKKIHWKEQIGIFRARRSIIRIILNWRKLCESWLSSLWRWTSPAEEEKSVRSFQDRGYRVNILIDFTNCLKILIDFFRREKSVHHCGLTIKCVSVGKYDTKQKRSLIQKLGAFNMHTFTKKGNRFKKRLADSLGIPKVVAGEHLGLTFLKRNQTEDCMEIAYPTSHDDAAKYRSH